MVDNTENQVRFRCGFDLATNDTIETLANALKIDKSEVVAGLVDIAINHSPNPHAQLFDFAFKQRKNNLMASLRSQTPKTTPQETAVKK